MLVTGSGLLASAGAYAFGVFDSLANQELLQATPGRDTPDTLTATHQPQNGTSGDTVRLFELTNRFDDSLQFVSARILNSTGAPIEPNSLSTPAPLAPGERGVVTVQLSCSTASSATLQVQIDAATASESVTLSEQVSIRCTGGQGDCPGA